jgi:hypothetical protein
MTREARPGGASGHACEGACEAGRSFERAINDSVFNVLAVEKCKVCSLIGNQSLCMFLSQTY